MTQDENNFPNVNIITPNYKSLRFWILILIALSVPPLGINLIFGRISFLQLSFLNKLFFIGYVILGCLFSLIVNIIARKSLYPKGTYIYYKIYIIHKFAEFLGLINKHKK